ncbi:MAG TPA: hypothetical protein VD788_16975 [Candidatus Polarisedimenticolaceae bacterium]|nr:hypothetical protein [Candidatus Polarisedimenticolaceae bacterium]
MADERQPDLERLERGLVAIGRSPTDAGRVELIACRPREGERRVLEQARLDVGDGLIGDDWKTRGSRRTTDGNAHPGMQLNVMNSRVIGLLAGDRARWPLAGDQLYVDLDLSTANLPPGTRLAVGSALIEVTAEPHLGCRKFELRFGLDALKFVNSRQRRHLNLRGINARVVRSGDVRLGDVVRKLPDLADARR